MRKTLLVMMMLLMTYAATCVGKKVSEFRVTMIPDSVFAMMQGKSYGKGCTIPRSQLRLIHCLIKDKNGITHRGEMVVNRKIADKVLDIFRQLYKAGYPIERMELIDKYGADDERSMRANNSSAFCYRTIAHSNKVSKHGYGLAVDINTLYNPYHRRTRSGREIIQPSTGRKYLDRTRRFDYKIERGDLCYRLFKAAGFSWGGDWKHSKDYQHFEY